MLAIMLSLLEMTIALPHFTFHAYITYHLEALLELCDASVPDFSILLPLPSFGGLKC